MSPDLERLSASLTALLARWRSTGGEPLPGQDAASVRAAFAKAGLAATPDVLMLYAAAGGMRMMDDDYWRLWPLDEIEDQKPSDRGVVFGDYCISCWEYRLLPATSSTCAVYIDHGDRPPALVAASLAEFLERLLKAPRALLDPGSR